MTMNDKEAGFDKDTLKRNIDKIADCTKQNSYSDQKSVQRVRELGKEMVDRPTPGN